MLPKNMSKSLFIINEIPPAFFAGGILSVFLCFLRLFIYGFRAAVDLVDHFMIGFACDDARPFCDIDDYGCESALYA